MALNAPVPLFSVGSISSAQTSGPGLMQSKADTVDVSDNSEPSPNTIPPVNEGDEISQEFEDDLSEQQLRELYDREEIDRFLNLFAAYVTEVRLPERAEIDKEKELWTDVSGFSTEPQGGGAELDTCESIDGTTGPPISLPCAPMMDLSEYIAYQYIIPNLPPAPLPPPLFTFGRLRVTTQRFYLAVEPAYKPFFANLKRLATWKDRRSSLMYCTVFWVLWWYNLLLPSLLLRIFFALARRKILPYPTLHELRTRRKEVARANIFGDAIQARLTPSSPFGVTELWRLFRVFNKPKMDRAKGAVKGEGKGKSKVANPESDGNTTGKSDPVGQKAEETPTVLDDYRDNKENGSKRVILEVLSDVADLHERVKNIFIWRRPASSYKYGGVLLFLFLVTLLLPTKYIAKLSYAVGGILFWHVTPVIAAIPPTDRARLPPAFDDVPTDADYAMELISQRVASGLNVKPSTFKRPRKRKPQTRNVEASGDDAIMSENEAKSVDWKKWGDRATFWKAWVDSGKQLFTGTETGAWPSHNRLLSRPDFHDDVPSSHIETRTFPAQHTSAPGLITLTPTIFFFTPLMSANARIAIALKDLRGVKKTGLLKGLSLRWRPSQDDSSVTEKEEKFMWVGDRDELFARLIGQDGRRWLKA